MASFSPGQYITVFADASYCPDTGASGYGWWIKFGSPAETLRGSSGGSTTSSHHAEVEALRAALRSVSALDPQHLQDKTLVVQSDCTGALFEIQAELHSLAQKLRLRKAYTKHVKGHHGYADARASVNTYCDNAAKREMRRRRNQPRGEAHR